MHTAVDDASRSVAEVRTSAYNIRRNSAFEIVAFVHQGALHLGKAIYRVSDDIHYDVSIVGLHRDGLLSSEESGRIKVVLAGVPSALVEQGHRIVQDAIAPLSSALSEGNAARRAGDRTIVEEAAAWLRRYSPMQVSVIAVSGPKGNPSIQEWGLAITAPYTSQVLILVVESVSYMD